MTDEPSPSMTFERIGDDLWMRRDRDGQVRWPDPVTTKVAEAYARILDVPAPETGR
jgi:hypothetical protein